METRKIIQTELKGMELEYTPNNKDIYICSKKVNSENIHSEQIESNHRKEKLLNVLNSMNLSQKQKNFEDFNFNTNCKKWIKSLLFDEDVIFDNLEHLMNDFSSQMNTNMREDEMYITAIFMKNRLILIHSRRGEESITPDLKVFKRMVDKDNIKRYVSFKRINNNIKVKYHEINKSKFFINWLGINENEASYIFGGENKFHSKINGIDVSFEISDNDYEKIMEDNNMILCENSIKFDKPIHELPLKYITRNQKKYNTLNEFERAYTSRKYDLSYYEEKYKKLISSLDPEFIKIYDNENEVSSICKRYYLKKENNNIEIIFCNKDIDITDEYIDKFKIKLLNEEETKCYHAGMSFYIEPLEIRNFKIYNEINTNLSGPLIKYYNTSDCSETFKKELLYGLLSTLIEDNIENPVSEFFKCLQLAVGKTLDYISKISEDNVIELKAYDFISGENDKFISNLSEDIINKMEESDYKLYILGYDEKIKEYEPFREDKYGDSRRDYLTREIKKATGLENIFIFKTSYSNNKCILMLAVKKN